MMPKYRVWDEYTGRIHDVVGFDFIETEVHYEKLRGSRSFNTCKRF